MRVYICSPFPPQCLCYSRPIPLLRSFFFSYNPLPFAPQHLLGCPCFGGAAKCLDRPSAPSVAGRDAYAPLGQLSSPASIWADCSRVASKNDMKKYEDFETTMLYALLPAPPVGDRPFRNWPTPPVSWCVFSSLPFFTPFSRLLLPSPGSALRSWE